MAADCKDGFYCKVANCATAGGTCTLKAALAVAPAKPVCGCDNVTYWNDNIAAHDGMNITSSGTSCPKNTAVPCNTTNVDCPAGRKCNLGVASSQQCSAILSGTCWRLPTTCPTGADQYSICGGSGAADCLNPCPVIRDETPFYFDTRCPKPPP